MDPLHFLDPAPQNVVGILPEPTSQIEETRARLHIARAVDNYGSQHTPSGGMLCGGYLPQHGAQGEGC